MQTGSEEWGKSFRKPKRVLVFVSGGRIRERWSRLTAARQEHAGSCYEHVSQDTVCVFDSRSALTVEIGSQHEHEYTIAALILTTALCLPAAGGGVLPARMRKRI
jgi:hypothetical protein